MITHSAKDLAIFAITQRKSLGLTQSEVADMVGLKQKTISAFENNPEKVMLSTAFLILSALNVELQLIGIKNSDKKSNNWVHPW